mgnify:CR=1 FL=1
MPLGNLFGPSEPARTPAKGSASGSSEQGQIPAADDTDEEEEKKTNEVRSELAQLEAELDDSSQSPSVRLQKEVHQGDYCQGWVGIHICHAYHGL